MNDATWRIAAERSGDYELIVRMRGTPFAKTVALKGRFGVVL